MAGAAGLFQQLRDQCVELAARLGRKSLPSASMRKTVGMPLIPQDSEKSFVGVPVTTPWLSLALEVVRPGDLPPLSRRFATAFESPVRLRDVVAHADELDPLVVVFRSRSAASGDFCHAGTTPGRPEVHYDDFPRRPFIETCRPEIASVNSSSNVSPERSFFLSSPWTIGPRISLGIPGRCASRSTRAVQDERPAIDHEAKARIPQKPENPEPDRTRLRTMAIRS